MTDAAASFGEAGALQRFQDAFAQALMAADPSAVADFPTEVARLIAQPGFAVYRNTVMKGCVDALQANYPSVARLVGEEWFRAAAAIYARARLPEQPMLLEYGAGFAEFLAAFPPAAELPYLPGVAQLDRCWTESHIAPDDALVEPAMIACLPPSMLQNAVLRPHGAARWAWFDGMPIVAIWRRNRGADANSATEIAWHGEGLLITRPSGALQNVDLDRAGCAFLDACACGQTLADAALAALGVDAEVDLARLMAQLLEAGTFGRLDQITDVIKETG